MQVPTQVTRLQSPGNAVKIHVGPTWLMRATISEAIVWWTLPQHATGRLHELPEHCRSPLPPHDGPDTQDQCLHEREDATVSSLVRPGPCWLTLRREHRQAIMSCVALEDQGFVLSS